MNTQEISTREDLLKLKQDLLTEIAALLKVKPREQEWLKSADVRKMLGISAGTLQTLRATGALPFTKLNGTLYYKHDDVQRALEQNMQNV